MDAANHALCCPGTTPLGGADCGFVPRDLPTRECEAVVGKAPGKLRICLAEELAAVASRALQSQGAGRSLAAT